jgi:hypothetical protein
VSSAPTLDHDLKAGLARALAEAPATYDEYLFDRLNPDFGVPADTRDPTGRQAVQDREAALALGTRAAVALSRENEPRPLIRLAGQDDRVGAVVRAARHRHSPERGAPER